MLASQDRPPVRVEATLHYSAERPFAVVMVLHAGGRDVEWHLSREQLLAGLQRRTGPGDVAVWPMIRRPGERVVCVRLASTTPMGVVVELPRDLLQTWLVETLRLIPRGSEMQYLHLDQEISEIFDVEE
ncbi:SsgA family sporulation/cell division regulator [Streptomyces sp. NPDC102487]|uniref:SsgA family sporulation/cell division regulator n=1 Tax=Streptomyces sp. NPDC102487 TaxID=3366182 RepID=UPI0037FC0F15